MGRQAAPIAELEHVTLRFDSKTQALADVTCSFFAAERVCILGANGSGKSTLASVLTGLLAPDEGRVSLVGRDVFDSSREEPIDFEGYRQARRKSGLVFQNPDDQIVTTVVEEDVAFGPENLGLGGDEIGRRVERELRRVALTSYAKADPTRLSGGQKQRVAIAATLAMEPAILVLDEPGSLLDVRGRAAIMHVMGRLADAGTTIVHITHFMDEALAADRVLVMRSGGIVMDGTPDEVFAHASELAAMGLEQPFPAQVSMRLGLPWTCSQETLVDEVCSQLVTDAAPAAPTRPSSNPAATAAIEVSHVSFSYRRDRAALDDVSLTIEAGTTCAIVGQTGSGKLTLVRLICALETPDEGHVLIGDLDTRRRRDRRRLHGTIGYVMQHPERQLFAETVLDDVAFGPTNLGLSCEEVILRARQALTQVGLTNLEQASPFELSGGQQRLCALAGILAMEPATLVLDEPTAGLDPTSRNELHSILARIHKHGTTVVQVTHSMEDAVRADKVIVLDQAHVLLTGRPEEVFTRENAPLLEGAGLGLPMPLQLAIRLEEKGLGHLFEPLTIDDLCTRLVRHPDADGRR